MRVFSLLAALLGSSILSTASWAETFVAHSRVSEVTIHPSVALISRHAEVELPAGRHRIELSGIPYDDVAGLRILHPGAARLGLFLRQGYPALVEVENPDRAAAETRVQEIEDQIAALEVDRARDQIAADGAEAVLGFVERLGKGEAATIPSSEELGSLFDTIASATTGARETILNAEVNARRFEKTLEELQHALKQAEAELEALSLESDEHLFMSLELEVPEAAVVPITITYPMGGVEWAPAYSWDLRTGDAPKVILKRDVMIMQHTGEDWTNVALRVSTSTPDQKTASGDIRPQRYVIKEEQQQRKIESSDLQTMGALAEPMVQTPFIAEEAAATVNSETDVAYEFSDPVTVHTGQELAMLSLPDLTLEAEIFAKVVPLRDDAAYRTARIENTSGEELLPADQSLLYVDGVLVGEDAFGGLLAGDTAELGFGPIDGLKVRRDLLDQSEGERGVISRSNQRLSRVEIELENTTAQSWPVQLFDRVPYSEQEDLEIVWTASPEVDIENHEKRRGVLGWDMLLSAGENKQIRLETQITWPEGYVLR